MRVGSTELASNPNYLASHRAIGACDGGTIPKDNDAVNGAGTVTPYGRIKPGTVLAQDATGLLHPCGLTEATAAATAVNALVVADSAAFRVGDLVSLAGADGPGTTFAAGAAAATLTVKPKVSALDIQIVVSGTSTAFSTTYNPITTLILINSATSGAAAATTTLAEIVAVLLSTYGALIASASASSGAAIAATTAATDVGTAAYAAVASDRAVVTVVQATKTITLDGAAFNVAVGDFLVKNLAYVPCGVNDVDVSTIRYDDVTEIQEARITTYRVEGDLRSSLVIGASNDGLLKKALSGDLWPDPLNGGALRRSDAALVGFRFKAI